MNDYAIYCSGGAGTILNFFSFDFEGDYWPKLVIYDGGLDLVANRINEVFEAKSKIVICQACDISEVIRKHMRTFQCFSLLCFGTSILRGKLLEEYRGKIFNFHPSLLPAFKGMGAIDKAIKAGVKILGCTVHELVEEVDSGTIVHQIAISTSNYSGYRSVLDLQFIQLLDILSTKLNYHIAESDLQDMIDKNNIFIK